MCVIAICEKRPLKKKEFDACWDGNGHGMGYAFWNGKTVTMRKGFMGKGKAWDEYKTVPVPHVVHFRIASAGEIVPELTHPFIVDEASPLFLEYTGTNAVLFHNGTVGNWNSILYSTIIKTGRCPEGVMSDSRAMAMAVSQIGKEFLDLFSSMKWVYVAKHGFHKVGAFVEEDGVFFSNSSFRPTQWAQGNHKTVAWGEPGSLWTTPHRPRLCTTCVYYSEEDKLECEMKGKITNRIACKDYEAKIVGEDDRYMKRSCSYCEDYEGQMFCNKKQGKMADLRACVDFKEAKKEVEESALDRARAKARQIKLGKGDYSSWAQNQIM